MKNNETTQKKAPQQKVWLKDEQNTAIVRRIEMHPNWGKQYLVTTYSHEWGPDTYWVKEKNVELMGVQHNG
jgi:hypothetical protein